MVKVVLIEFYFLDPKNSEKEICLRASRSDKLCDVVRLLLANRSISYMDRPVVFSLPLLACRLCIFFRVIPETHYIMNQIEIEKVLGRNIHLSYFCLTLQPQCTAVEAVMSTLS